jgi:hypothetical protein
MGARSARRVRAPTLRPARAIALLLVASAIVGISAPVGSISLGGPRVSPAIVALVSPQNGSTGSDPSSSSASVLCPSAGPVFLGIQWNCVAVLNLTELVLILLSIGIVAYVFKDADRAELPGESAEVPVTAEEWEAYRREKKLGIPYDPGPPPGGEEDR